MQGQKTLLLSYNMHLFFPYLLKDYQTSAVTGEQHEKVIFKNP